MKKTILILILILSVFITACGIGNGPAVTETPASTSTPDRCTPAALPGEVTKANNLMREFDDYSSLASNTPQSQLIMIIPDMQRILRDTEDLPAPACLQTLKKLEMAHMNLVIQTLMAFMNKSDVKLVNAGIAQARDLHHQYDVELARLLGITLVPRPTSPPATPGADTPATATAVVALVTNPGPGGVNLRNAPDLNGLQAGVLDAAASTKALGRTADGQWIQVEVPGQPGSTAWVFASLIQLSVPIEQLPIVTP